MYNIRIGLKNNPNFFCLTLFILIFIEVMLKCVSSYFADNEYLIA
jgi:hypothetical protein